MFLYSKGKKVHIHKRMILCNLKEPYISFKGQNPEKLQGFSNFTELLSKNCVLVGVSCTHAICVTIHQNVELIISDAKSNDLTEKQTTAYHTCITKIICSVLSLNCYHGNGKTCPGTENLIKNNEHIFEDNNKANITYNNSGSNCAIL